MCYIMCNPTKRRQYCIKLHNKGQINVEYFVGLTVFMVVSLYFAFRLTSFYPEYLRNIKEEILRSDAYRLSELLINDDGDPVGWTELSPGDVITRLGLSSEASNSSNLLNISKVAAFETLCTNDYRTVKELVGARHDFYIFVNATTTTYACNYLQSDKSISVITRPVAFDNGNYGKLIVHMWW